MSHIIVNSLQGCSLLIRPVSSTKKTFIITLLTIFAVAVGACAESSVTLTGVHNCCKGCSNGITKAITSVAGTTCTADKGTVTITAKNEDDAKRAVAALLDAGYFGEGATADTASDVKAKSVTVDGDISPKELLTALNKGGFNGKVK